MEQQTAARNNNDERCPLASIGNCSPGNNTNHPRAWPKRSATVSSQLSHDNTAVSSDAPHGKNEKPKILCLGMSTPDVSSYIQDSSTITVKQIIELVKNGNLSQIDGRDFARCRATEILHNVDVYTVSMEDGHAMQEERHVYANFNRQGFVSNVLRKAFGNPIFYQVIIDYFWCPDSWKKDHWKKSFFRNTLPKFADLGMVCGAVYLPFSLYCIKQVIKYWQLMSSPSITTLASWRSATLANTCYGVELPQSMRRRCRECWAKTFPKKTFTVQLQQVMSWEEWTMTRLPTIMFCKS